MDDRRVLNDAIEDDGDPILAGTHVLRERDHLVGARPIKGDVHRVHLAHGRTCDHDIGSAERRPAVKKDGGGGFIAVFILLSEFISAVTGNDFLAVEHALGEGFTVLSNFVVAGRYFPQLEFRNGLQSNPDCGRFFRPHTRHLDQDAVLTLADNQRLGGAHGIEAVFDHAHALFDLVRCDGHLLTLFVFLCLDAEQERGAAGDVDAGLEAFFWRKNREGAEAADTDEENRADIALPALDLGGEIPEEEDQQREADGEENERILEKYDGKHGKKWKVIS